MSELDPIRNELKRRQRKRPPIGVLIVLLVVVAGTIPVGPVRSMDAEEKAAADAKQIHEEAERLFAPAKKRARERDRAIANCMERGLVPGSDRFAVCYREQRGE